jgi:fatty acid desaturase
MSYFWISKTLIILNTLLLFSLFLGLFYFPNFTIYFWLGIFISLHFSLNFLHQGSHRLFDKSSKINYFFTFLASFFTGLTTTEFTYTHNAHHKFLGQLDKDIDSKLIETRPLLLFPFFVWQKDVFFWQNAGTRSKLIYIFERISWLGFLVGFYFVFGYYNFLAWMFCLLVLGYLNTFYLFYFPHHIGRFENWCKHNLKFIFPKAILKTIKISRSYHLLHHEKPYSPLPYYPVEHSIINKVKTMKKIGASTLVLILILSQSTVTLAFFNSQANRFESVLNSTSDIAVYQYNYQETSPKNAPGYFKIGIAGANNLEVISIFDQWRLNENLTLNPNSKSQEIDIKTVSSIN